MLTGQAPNDSATVKPESARAKVGRRGELKGGKARAKALSWTITRLQLRADSSDARRDPGHGTGISDNVWSAEEIARLAD